jgi:DNA-binding transcriptional ArsR family regulator
MRRQPPLLLPLFRSDGQARLLARVYLFPDRPRPLADLARELGIDRGTLTREADRLEQAGLVRSERIGRQRILHPDADSLYFDELSGLLLKALGPANLIGPAVAELQNVEQAFLIGSWAARYLGETGPPPGDIDVLLIGSPEWGAVSRLARELTSVLGQEVNPTILSREQWDDQTDGFVRQVRREPRLELSLGSSRSVGGRR